MMRPASPRCAPLFVSSAAVKRAFSGCAPHHRALIHEVAPRDGLQNEEAQVGLHGKLALMEALIRCEPYSIEVTSFVRPDRVPQLADADELCARLAEAPWAVQARERGMRFAGLVPNMKGVERCLDARAALDTVSVITSATDGHSLANVGMTVVDAIRESSKVCNLAKAEGMAVRGYVSMAFGCPITPGGATDPAVVLDIVAAYADSGADVIVLADTIGHAVPKQVEALCREAQAHVPTTQQLGLHMHDTRGHALENCAVALRLGWEHFDSAVGGCGGCPFAPGAAGNLATEELLALLDDSEEDGVGGCEHGMQTAAVVEAVDVLRSELNPG